MRRSYGSCPASCRLTRGPPTFPGRGAPVSLPPAAALAPKGVEYGHRPKPTLCPQAQKKRGGPTNVMKKLFLLIASVCLPAIAPGQVVEEIIARVNNQIITKSEFQRSKDQLRDEVKQQDPNNADKVYAEKRLPLEAGRSAGVTSSPKPDHHSKSDWRGSRGSPEHHQGRGAKILR